MTTITTALHLACANFNERHAHLNDHYYHIDALKITDTSISDDLHTYQVSAVIHYSTITKNHVELIHRINLDCTISIDHDVNPFSYRNVFLAFDPPVNEEFTFHSLALTITPYTRYIAPIHINSDTYELTESLQPDSLLYDVYGDDDPYKPHSYVPCPHTDTFDYIFTLCNEVITTALKPESLDA